MKVQTEKLAALVAEASVGTSSYEVSEQSVHIIFHEGKIHSFNGDVLFSADCPFDLGTIIVSQKDLAAILNKIPDEEIEVTTNKANLIIKGKRKRAGLSFVNEVLAPIHEVTQALGKWQRLPDTMRLSMMRAAETCGRDHSKPASTLVHMGPNVIEGSDTFRLYHDSRETGLKQEVLMPSQALAVVLPKKPIKINVGDGWVHFRSRTKAIISVRMVTIDYPDTTEILKVKDGSRVTFPSSLAAVVTRAATMGELGFDARVNVAITDGRIEVTAKKASSWYKEVGKTSYTGQDVSFSVHPQVILSMLSQTQKAIIGRGRLKIKNDNITFIAACDFLNTADE